MPDLRRRDFSDNLDIIQALGRAARKGLGEDSFYCSKWDRSAVVSVFDGCGGLGSRTYDSFRGHTGAYMASRTVSGAVHDWYHANYRRSWSDTEELKASVDGYIRRAYAVCERFAVDHHSFQLRGSMVRTLPTTMALAYAEEDREGVLLQILWAGDSRVYLMDKDGLAQLTRDDTDTEDAFENLTQDSAMTNVLSADGRYVIHGRKLRLTRPALIFAATDGCFGYVSSPMEFEYLFLEALIQSETPEAFKKNLRARLGEYAGDDLTMGLMSFFYGTFKRTKRALSGRYTYLRDTYADALGDVSGETAGRTEELWQSYKPAYERYL